MFKKSRRNIMIEEDKAAFDLATKSQIYDEIHGNDKVRDYDHISGKYRPTHNNCNFKLLIYPYKIKVPLVFYNLRSYDGHLIMKELGKTKSDWWNKVNCIHTNKEKYMTFSIGNFSSETSCNS